MMSGRPDRQSIPESSDRLAPAVRWLFVFQVFNAASFTLALGAPLVLSARYIGASEIQIGLLASMTPLLMVLQLVAANMIDRIGCRRLMMAGWGLRAVFLFFIVPLPLLVGVLPPWLLVGIMALAMLGFNAVRGFASAAWFPWLTAVVPEKVRGRYVGIEQLVINISAFLTLILCGLFLGDEPGAWRYSALFFVSAMAGFVGVWFLGKAPEYHPPPRPRRLRKLSAIYTNLRIAWRYPPFRRTFRFVLVFTIAAFSFPAFLVLYQREVLGWGDGVILKLQAVMTLGVLLSAFYFGKASDRIGSRPMLRLGDLSLLFFILFWIWSAYSEWTPSYLAAALSFLLWGCINAAHAVAQVRLTLGCCPPKHISYSMALFMVLTSLAGAMAPIAFGWILSFSQVYTASLSHAYAILFCLSFLLVSTSQFLLGAVPDPRAVHTRQVLLLMYGWPLRVLSGVRFSGTHRKPKL